MELDLKKGQFSRIPTIIRVRGRKWSRPSLFARLLFLFFSFGGLICILQGMHLGFADPRAWKEYGSKQA